MEELISNLITISGLSRSRHKVYDIFVTRFYLAAARNILDSCLFCSSPQKISLNSELLEQGTFSSYASKMLAFLSSLAVKPTGDETILTILDPANVILLFDQFGKFNLSEPLIHASGFFVTLRPGTN